MVDFEHEVDAASLRFRSSAARLIIESITYVPDTRRQVMISVWLTNSDELLTIHLTWGASPLWPEGGRSFYLLRSASDLVEVRYDENYDDIESKQPAPTLGPNVAVGRHG